MNNPMPRTFLLALLAATVTSACAAPAGEQGSTDEAGAVSLAGQATVQDDDSEPDVVKVAVGSKDHTTLVAALQAADLVNSLANAGPFTVFAPVNAAFDKLPKGTVDDLLKPANKDKLRDILQHHVTVPVLLEESLTDGMVLGMVDGTSATISRRGADLYIDDAKVLAVVRASNGIVYVIDSVVLPKG
jgi:uncharacterized surface protein with fasciclin (FAS1) repeats